MEAKTYAILRVGVLAVTGVVTVLLSAGCETSDTMAVSPTNPMCPLGGRQTQAQALAGLDCTKAVCPACGQIATVDPEFLDRLEICTGGPLGDPVYACADCKALVAQCATCRQCQAKGL